MMRKDSAAKLTGNNQFEGYAIDLIREISMILGFNFTFRLVPDGRYGSMNKLTGEWDGMVRELLEQRADLAIGDLTITYEREQVVDFTMPVSGKSRLKIITFWHETSFIYFTVHEPRNIGFIPQAGQTTAKFVFIFIATIAGYVSYSQSHWRNREILNLIVLFRRLDIHGDGILGRFCFTVHPRSIHTIRMVVRSTSRKN